MLCKVFVWCLTISLCAAAASSLSCRWMDHKFKDYNKNAMKWINQMFYNSTNMTDTLALEEDTVVFPQHLYAQAAKASAEDRLSFVIQIIEEVTELFKEDTSAASWKEVEQDNFLNVINQQASGLRTCITRYGKKKSLQMFFKKLSDFLKKTGHSVASWEFIRRQIKVIFFRADHLLTSPLN